MTTETTTTTIPALLPYALQPVHSPDGSWVPRMWDLALASTDREEASSFLTMKMVAASHGYDMRYVQQEVPDDLADTDPAEILAAIAPPTDAPVDGILVGRTMDEDGVFNWYAWNRRAAPSPAPAAPSVAQPEAPPLAKLLSLAARVEEKVNAEGGDATVSRIVALTVTAINEASRQEGGDPDDERGVSKLCMDLLREMHDAPTMAAGYELLADFTEHAGLGTPVALQPAQGGSVSEVAKRIAWAYWLSLDTLRPDADRDRAWDHLTDAAKQAWLAAARASAPAAPEVVMDALRIAYARLDTIAAEDGRVGAIADLVRTYDAALRAAGEGK
ncbi:hypothetical protein [Azospirillum picis]|uniref:Uncharacterized protein n=1 Tax=Azospirillum picis TaxID=488438 RepID=A0ABU0MPM7_9PROT|nr:hypothetical protein [Azospirillum picis]MBP2301524.1 hypothetical protein [Azospirillum picis]MDQ0535356.1 hypothetical protein [Azospirillum picis]